MSITIDKLKIFEKYSGNIEDWDRFGKQKDKNILGYEEWELIEQLIQSIGLIEKGLASETFEEETMDKLKKACNGEEVTNKLKSLTKKYF